MQSILKQSVLTSSGSVLLEDFLPDVIRQPQPTKPAGARSRAPQSFGDVWDCFVDERLRAGSSDIYKEGVDITEREVISRVLRHTNGNQVQATKLLGITRSTLRSKITQLGISIETVVDTD